MHKRILEDGKHDFSGRAIHCTVEEKTICLHEKTADGLLKYALELNYHGHVCNDSVARIMAIEVLYEIKNYEAQRFWNDSMIQGALRQAQRGELISVATAPCEEYFQLALKRISFMGRSKGPSQARFLLSLSYLKSEEGTEILLARQLRMMKTSDGSNLKELAEEARMDASVARQSSINAWDEIVNYKRIA